MKCPDCDKTLREGAASCRCGWREKGKSVDHPLGYSQCEWRANGERCRFPGTISSNTNGHGPWYCAGHDGCRDPLMGAAIVDRSLGYRPPTVAELDAAHLAKLRDPGHRPRVRACEARECVNRATMREDGHYRCHLHLVIPVDDLWIPPKPGEVMRRAAAFVRMAREPGSDDE